VNGIFALKRCSAQKFPEGFKPCLNYHIRQCRGVCTGLVSREEYQEAIGQVVDLLNGKSKRLLDYLNERMSEEASAMNLRGLLNTGLYRCLNAVTEIKTKGRSFVAGIWIDSGRQRKNDDHVVCSSCAGKAVPGKASSAAMAEDDLKMWSLRLSSSTIQRMP
jgi:hypothetical protein